jgi:hypothetical protein
MREEKENQLVPERGGKIPQGRRKWARTVAGLWSSGEKSLCSFSMIPRISKGGWRRRVRPFYRWVRGWNGQAITRELKRRGGYCSQRVTVTGVVTGRRWKKTGHWGPLVSEWERDRVPVRDRKDGSPAGFSAGPTRAGLAELAPGLLGWFWPGRPSGLPLLFFLFWTFF